MQQMTPCTYSHTRWGYKRTYIGALIPILTLPVRRESDDKFVNQLGRDFLSLCSNYAFLPLHGLRVA
jgi:hypothetical protein